MLALGHSLLQGWLLLVVAGKVHTEEQSRMMDVSSLALGRRLHWLLVFQGPLGGIALLLGKGQHELFHFGSQFLLFSG